VILNARVADVALPDRDTCVVCAVEGADDAAAAVDDHANTPMLLLLSWQWCVSDADGTLRRAGSRVTVVVPASAGVQAGAVAVRAGYSK
jgi:hypothetical protein